MYSIKLDNDKYFLGSYAKVGKVDGGIDIPTLPPSQDSLKATCYKYDYKDVEVPRQVPKMKEVIIIDELTNEEITSQEYELTEDGDVVYETVYDIEKVLDWIYDEEKYNSLQEEIANKVPEPTIGETIEFLKNENDLLKGCVMELAEILFA